MKYFLFLCLSFAVFCHAAETPLAKGFSDLSKVKIHQAVCTVSDDGSRIAVDTLKNPHAWNQVFHTAKGLLKPNTDYTAVIRYKVKKPSSAGSFLLLCRPLGVSGNQHDTFSMTYREADHLTALRLHFKTGNRPDYAFMVFTFKKVLGELADFTLYEGKNESFIPFDTETGNLQGSAQLPTGSVEFEVQKPHAGTKVIRAADFGFSAAAPDNTSALNRAIEACLKTGASRLELAPGVYRMTSGKSVMFRKINDLEIDGKGAVLQFCTSAEWLIQLVNCKRIYIHDLIMDWDIKTKPLASIVEVLGTGKNFVDLKFPADRKFADGKLRISVMSSFDPQTKSVGVENGKSRYLQFWAHNKAPQYQWLKPDVLRLFTDPGIFRKGQFYRAQHFYYDHHGFRIMNVEHLKMENVKVHGVAGHAFFIDGESAYLHFRNVAVTIPEGEEMKRAVSCTADHVHVARSRGFLKFEDCDFGYGGDDCINVHDCAGFGKRISSDTIRTERFYYIWSYAVGDECEIRYGDFSQAVKRVRIKAVRKIKGGVNEITFEAPIPAAADPDMTYLIYNWKYDSSNVIIRNCRIHDNRANGIRMLGRNVTLEGNHFFHNEQSAIRIENGYCYAWSEGYGVSNVVLKNNVFERANAVGTQENGKVRDLVINVYAGTEGFISNTGTKIIRDILFENNTFKNTFGLVCYISGAENVIFRNNTMINDMTRKNRYPYRGSFYLENVSGATFVNNLYPSSEYVSDPGVICADDESVQNLIVGGNRIIKK